MANLRLMIFFNLNVSGFLIYNCFFSISLAEFDARSFARTIHLMPKHEDAEDSSQCNIECYQDTRTATSLLIPPSLDRYKQTFRELCNSPFRDNSHNLIYLLRGQVSLRSRAANLTNSVNLSSRVSFLKVSICRIVSSNLFYISLLHFDSPPEIRLDQHFS